MTEDALDVDAAAARAALVQGLVDGGDLSDVAWREAFERVPRHLFVPFFYDHAGRVVSGADPERRDQWFAAVHEDRALVTHRTGGAATSSSTQPSLMAVMLEALEVADGMRVLEVGTGTGYNAGLLAHRLGDGNVVSVDVSVDITGPARERLDVAGYRPLVVTGDGGRGHRERAPYERIIVTCRLGTVPYALVEQLSADGLLLAPVGDALARIRRVGERRAEGRFLAGGAFFMPLRATPGAGAPSRRPGLPEGAGRAAALPGHVLADNRFRFLISVVEPDLAWQYDLDDGGRTVVGARIWHGDGSIASFRRDGSVSQSGPRCLADRLEDAFRVWRDRGEPGPERYGVTIGGGCQRIWLDTESGTGWERPLPS